MPFVEPISHNERFCSQIPTPPYHMQEKNPEDETKIYFPQKKAYLHHLQKNERICESWHKEYCKESTAKSVGESWHQCYEKTLSGDSLF